MTNSNFQVKKHVINFIHAKDFFPEDYAERYHHLMSQHTFTATKFGEELLNFNVIYPELELVFGKMIGDFVKVDREKSGVFRKTLEDVVRFEDFGNLKEWRFVAALEDMEFKIFSHHSGIKSALEITEDMQIDYTNSEEWTVETHITLRRNDSIFFRPWVFHSFSGGMVYYYKMETE